MDEEIVLFLSKLGMPDGLNEIQARAFVSERLQETDILNSRSGSFRPETLDLEKRTIDYVIASENTVRIFDFNRFEIVDEKLLMSGVRLDELKNDKIPMIDTHDRSTVRNLKGSFENLRVEDGGEEGDLLVATGKFSRLSEPEFTKAAEGHLDGASVGFNVASAVFIEPGETVTVDGTPFTASDNRALKIVTSWEPREGSLAILGADSLSGSRSTDPKHKQKTQKKENIMDEETRNYLISIGMPSTATEEEARTFQKAQGTKPAPKVDPPAPVPAPADPDPDEAQRKLDAEEKIKETAKIELRAELKKRTADMDELFTPYMEQNGVPELRKLAEDDEKMTVDQMRKQVLDHLAKETKLLGRGGKVLHDESDNFRIGACAAIELRTPDVKMEDLSEEERALAPKYEHMDMVDLARMFLEIRGKSTRGNTKDQIISRALTNSTGDFPLALSNVANKSTLRAYEAAQTTWRLWTQIRSLNDFKTASIIATGGFGVMPKVVEGEKFPYHTFSEKQETWFLETFGKTFPITRQALINDDLSVFTTVPAGHGTSWARTINQQLVAILLLNADLADSIALFEAAVHKNITEDAGHNPTSKSNTEAAIRAATLLFRQQTDIGGEDKLNIPPNILLGGPTAEPFIFEALLESGKADNNSDAFIRNLSLTPVIEPELENTNLTGSSVKAMYFFANTSANPVVLAGFLNGNDAPRMERMNEFNNDVLKLKVAGDMASGIADFRGAVKTKGEA